MAEQMVPSSYSGQLVNFDQSSGPLPFNTVNRRIPRWTKRHAASYRWPGHPSCAQTNALVTASSSP